MTDEPEAYREMHGDITQLAAAWSTQATRMMRNREPDATSKAAIPTMMDGNGRDQAFSIVPVNQRATRDLPEHPTKPPIISTRPMSVWLHFSVVR